MTPDSDATLVARVVTGDDRAAFELLVRRHQSPVRNFLRRLTRDDPARADDLAQETFIKLFRSIGTYRAQAKFTTWLYRIAYRTFLDDQRSRALEVALIDEDHVMPDSAMAAADEWDVSQAMRYLNARQRAVFDLHYGKGMTHEEIAQALELPIGTAKSDLSRGLEKLQRALVNQESG